MALRALRRAPRPLASAPSARWRFTACACVASPLLLLLALVLYARPFALSRSGAGSSASSPPAVGAAAPDDGAGDCGDGLRQGWGNGTAACAWLDMKHTIFGRVTRGMDAVHSIEAAECNPKNDRPYEAIKIVSVDVK